MPPMTPLEDDPRVRRGMERQLDAAQPDARRGRPADRLEARARHAARRWSSTGRPPRSSASSPIAPCSRPATWSPSAAGASPPPSRRSPSTSRPTSRPPPTATTAAAAIGGLGVAFELVDIAGGEVEEILAGDIFHRHVVLGPASAGIDAADLRGEIAHGDEMLVVDDPLALVARADRRPDPPLGPPGRVRRDRQGRRRADHRLDRPRPRDRSRRPRELPAGAARGAHARRLGALSPGYTPRALAPMAELVDAPG